MEPAIKQSTVLMVGANGQVCALPLADVIEIMRPLPVTGLPDTPAFLRGIAVIRGQPTPVVDLAMLLGAPEPGGGGRFVLMRCGDRQLALALSTVSGVTAVATETWEELPPLLQHSLPEFVDVLAAIDSHLLFVLRAGRLLPADAMAQLDTALREFPLPAAGAAGA